MLYCWWSYICLYKPFHHCQVVHSITKQWKLDPSKYLTEKNVITRDPNKLAYFTFGKTIMQWHYCQNYLSDSSWHNKICVVLQDFQRVNLKMSTWCLFGNILKILWYNKAETKNKFSLPQLLENSFLLNSSSHHGSVLLLW